MRKRTVLLAFVLLAALPLVGQTPFVPGGGALDSFTLKTTTGAGATLALQSVYGVIPSKYAWTVTFLAAGPTGQTTNLEGSLDGVYWYTVDSSTDTTYASATSSGALRFVVDKPVKLLRCNLAVYTAGSNTGVTCRLIATP